MGVIGDRDSVLGFKAAGLDVFPVATPLEAQHTLHRLAKDDYAVIFIVEQTAGTIPEAIDRYKSQPTPAIIPIPGSRGGEGMGMRGLRKNVERAIGADILFGKEG
jgi:V/A-type H+-transporting ATPase subunit F